jgi:TldD protein
VIDDPTQRKLNGLDLGGWYEFDDEGIPATKVEVIKDGVLKNFLMSRMPIKNFANSNGHGRSQPGAMPTGRQGNLIVSSTKTVNAAGLRQKLIEEVKKQGKPYGLYFEDIQEASRSRSGRCRRRFKSCRCWCGGFMRTGVQMNWCAASISSALHSLP